GVVLRRRGLAALAAGEVPAGAIGARTLACLAHVERAAMQLVTVERRDRLLGLARRTHLDEAEAPGPASGAVGDYRCRLAASGLREQRLEVGTAGVEGKVADEQLLAHL